MGEKCFVATKLNYANLRKVSMPFDWLAGATFEDRFNLFLNKFEGFFDRKDLTDRGVKDGKRICKNEKTKITFIHDFSVDGDFDEEYNMVSEKYDRRINRLLETLQQDKDILIMYAELPNSKHNVANIEDLKTLIDKANQIYNANISLLYIKHNPNISHKDFEIRQIYDNVLYTEINNYKKRKVPAVTPYNDKNISAVISRFGLKK